MSNGTFFTSIGCMDGRVQKIIAEFGQKKFDAEYPDTITDAGLVGKLSRTKKGDDFYESIKSKLLISLEKHNSKGIVVHGHAECAGNPVDEKQHVLDIKKTADVLSKMVGNKIEIIPVFVSVKVKVDIGVQEI